MSSDLAQVARIARVQQLVERFSGEELRAAQMLDLLDHTVLWTCDLDGVVTMSVGGGLYTMGLVPGQVVGGHLSQWGDVHLAAAFADILRGRSRVRVQTQSPHWPGRAFISDHSPQLSASGRIIGMVTITTIVDSIDEITVEVPHGG